ncbi:hypothetical protein KBB27_03660 [Patescibacteria group bacterium]|nr:hypothetical protein [Patescibacteria group bacterium]
MWTIDATQHIHVEPSVSEREVLERAASVARLSAQGSPVFLDLLATETVACACGQPDPWKTYQVILYAVGDGKRSES